MRKSLFFLIVLMFCSSVYAEKDRLAVMDVTDEDGIFAPRTIVKVTDYIFSKLQETKAYWMVPMADRDNALEQAIEETVKGSRKECVDEKCQLSLVAQLQANFLINTKIKKLYEGTCNITISKFDVEKRAGVDSWVSDFNCSEKGLFEAVNSLNFGGKKKTGSSFQTGKIGETVENWEVGTGEETIVKFESEPTGAVILVDGKLVCQTTPCSKMITMGKHEIVIQKENYLSKMKVFDIKKGQSIKAELAPDFGWLNINSPVEIDLILDGQKIGATPLNQKIINPGAHQIETDSDCYYKTGEKFLIKRGETKSITLDLKPKESAIKVRAKDETGNDVEADVFVDGKKIGVAPGTFKVPLCSNTLVISNEEGKYKKDISEILVEQKTSEINVTIKEKIRKNERPEKFEENEVQATKIVRPYAWIGWTSLALGVASFGAAVYFNFEIGSYNSNAEDVYDPQFTSDAKGYIKKAETSELRRNVFLGVGAGLLCVGVIMFFVKTEKVPVALYFDDKKVMFSYNMNF